MPDVYFGGTAVNSNTEGGVYTPVAAPLGYPHRTGSLATVIQRLAGFVGGRGAARSLRLYFGASGVDFVVGASAGAPATGMLDSTDWLVEGGVHNFGYTNMSGPCNFARSNGGGTSYGQYGNFGGVLGGALTYASAPKANSIAQITPSEDGTSVFISLAASPDDGGAGIIDYVIQYSLDPTFATGVIQFATNGQGDVITGLIPGGTYYYQSLSRNYVTTAAGTGGSAWSPTAYVTQPAPAASGLGTLFNGSSFVPGDGLIRSSDNSVWLPAAGKIRNADNTAWLDLA